MREVYVSRIKQIACEAGRIALEMMQKSSPTLKPDNSVLTEADTQVSCFIRQQLQDFLNDDKHALLDEEDAQKDELFDQSVLESKKYLWVVDPIDGTRAFSNKMPLFGISIGLLKDLQPWLGAVYFPAARELFYCDGQDSFFVQNAFCEDERGERIHPVDQQISMQSLFLVDDMFFNKFGWDCSICRIMMVCSAAIDLCWPAIGRGCGCVFKAHLWDLAGSWPIARSAGLELRELSSGRVLDRIRTDFFIGEGMRKWKLKDYYLLSSKRNFDEIKKIITSSK